MLCLVFGNHLENMVSEKPLGHTNWPTGLMMSHCIVAVSIMRPVSAWLSAPRRQRHYTEYTVQGDTRLIFDRCRYVEEWVGFAIFTFLWGFKSCVVFWLLHDRSHPLQLTSFHVHDVCHTRWLNPWHNPIDFGRTMAIIPVTVRLEFYYVRCSVHKPQLHSVMLRNVLTHIEKGHSSVKNVFVSETSTHLVLMCVFVCVLCN